MGVPSVQEAEAARHLRDAVWGSSFRTKIRLCWSAAQTSLRVGSYIRPRETIDPSLPIGPVPPRRRPNHAFFWQSYSSQRNSPSATTVLPIRTASCLGQVDGLPRTDAGLALASSVEPLGLAAFPVVRHDVAFVLVRAAEQQEPIAFAIVRRSTASPTEASRPPSPDGWPGPGPSRPVRPGRSKRYCPGRRNRRVGTPGRARTGRKAKGRGR